MKVPKTNKAIADLLFEQAKKYNNKTFIEDDPISIPHKFTAIADIEISALFAATIAWGNRKSILKNGNQLMQLMDFAPYQFVMQASNNELRGLNKFVHRTFNGQDALAFVDALRQAYNHKGLQALFTPNYPDIRLQHEAYMHPMAATIFNFRHAFTKSFKWQRSAKHIGNPFKNSSAKRMCMFLRWMVRQDKNGVDFGIWKNINPADLICPLDVHSGSVARELGLLTRSQNDWKAAVALTENLKQYNASDPSIFDFALFGMGVNSKRLAINQ